MGEREAKAAGGDGDGWKEKLQMTWAVVVAYVGVVVSVVAVVVVVVLVVVVVVVVAVVVVSGGSYDDHFALLPPQRDGAAVAPDCPEERTAVLGCHHMDLHIAERLRTAPRADHALAGAACAVDLMHLNTHDALPGAQAQLDRLLDLPLKGEGFEGGKLMLPLNTRDAPASAQRDCLPRGGGEGLDIHLSTSRQVCSLAIISKHLLPSALKFGEQ
eukprot:352602-Chlamydomonas_euryale.AAC.2